MDTPTGWALVRVPLASTAVGLLPFLVLRWGLDWWANRRDQRRWAEEDRRQALQRQLRDLEDQIWRESLPDWQREAIEEADRKRAAIKEEARRRLGLPDEETP